MKPIPQTRTIPVKIDDKRTIFIAPGEDPETAKQNYLKSLEATKSHYISK